MIATSCLVAIAAWTGFVAWIIRPIVDELFYKQRYELVPLICGAVILAFVIRGLSTYGQAVTLAEIGNNLVAATRRASSST